VLDNTVGYNVINEVLTALVFWDMTPCILVESCGRFDETCFKKGGSRFLRNVGKSITALHLRRKYSSNLYYFLNMCLEFMS